MLPYGLTWKKQRKLCHAALNQNAVKTYLGIQEDAVALFINSLLQKPSEFVSQLRLYVSQLVPESKETV